MARVLVADDESILREMVRVLLEREGHEVFETMTGMETWDFLEKSPPDLLLLDVMLPEMDGYTLQMKLAENPRTRVIPVIVLTALDAAATMFQKFSQVKAVLAKPFLPATLVATVRKSLGGAA